MTARGRSTTLLRALPRPIEVARVVILADTPEAMQELGPRPLLWHLLMRYAAAGCKEFVVGVRDGGEQIKRFLIDLCALSGNVSVNLLTGEVERDERGRLDWSVDVVGVEPGLRRLRDHVEPAGAFVLARGDVLTDLSLPELLHYHRQHGALATLVTVRQTARFGELTLVGDEVVDFSEKPLAREDWTGGGIAVLEPAALEYIEDQIDWQQALVERLAPQGGLMAYKHESFWQRPETLRDRQLLESLWQAGRAPWKDWE